MRQSEWEPWKQVRGEEKLIAAAPVRETGVSCRDAPASLGFFFLPQLPQ